MKVIDEEGNISPEFQSIIDNTNDLVFVKNRELVYIASSKNYALNCIRCNGVEDVIGKTDYELFDDPMIAEKYRTDDIALFESGEDMFQFEEEYPNRNGTKQRCLTTKYLLKDNNGNPVAIFGQYNSIGKLAEEEIKRRREIDGYVIDALSKSFFAANYADLKADKYVTVRSMDYARRMLDGCETLEQAFEAFINTLVRPEYEDKMREFCDVSTIAQRVKGKTHIDAEYLSKVAHGWCQASFYPTEWDEDGEVTHVLFAVSRVDDDKAREIEESIANKSNISTMRTKSIQVYKERLQSLQKSNEDALCMCDVNLTRNEFSGVQADGVIKKCSEAADTLDAFMILASNAVFDPEEQQEYRSLFCCDELLKRFENGETHIRFDHFYRIDRNTTSMVATVFDLIKEPISGDVVGIAYAKDLNHTKVSNIMLNAALSKDYPMAALLYADTGEYYYYEVAAGETCSHKQDYWGAVYDLLKNAVDSHHLEEIRSNLNRDNVISHLDEEGEFTYAFSGMYHGKYGRYEAKFRYIDRKHYLVLAVLRNITDVELAEKYKYESEHDMLTGLFNRNTVFAYCRELLDTYPDEQFVMLHLDVKYFHLYNSFFGDEGGDELLCGIAEELKKLGKEYDYFACGRIEADVFCVFFPVGRGLFEKHIKRSFDELEAFSPNFPLRLAIGAYWVVDSTMSIEAMFSRATIAARSDKKNLFGLISRYDENMDQELKATQQITSEMTTAIEEEEFQVYLQPKYALQSDRIVGSEALVRWIHPTRGLISPGAFIPVFEKNGYIAELDKYMWEHVCQVLRRWQNEGKPMYPVSVNISRVSMYSHLTVPFLKELIAKYEIDPQYLELELTETAYMDDPEDLKRMLKELQDFGFKILMDDFGNGYSSLNTLRDLPVDILKLDMNFLSKTQADERGRAVLSSVVRMSKLLKLPIVAEGVEEREQAEYLRSIGCEYVQGFLYAKPMPVSEYEELLGDQPVLIEAEALGSNETIWGENATVNSEETTCGESITVNSEEITSGESTTVNSKEAVQNKLDEAEAQRYHSLEIEASLWNSVKKLVSLNDVKASTNSIIEKVLEYYEADRAYIFEFDWENNCANNTYESCAPNVEAMITELQQLPIAAFDAWIKLFRERSLIHITNIDDLIGDDNRRAEYEILEPQGIQSLIAAPVYYEGNLVGLLGVDNPKCNVDDTTFISSLAFFCVNVSIKEREIAELEMKNILDPLTGAYNRLGYNQMLSKLKADQRPMAYIQLDIDNFKLLNDTYGHDFGDEALKQVVIQLNNAFRTDDYVFRLGGDEFAVVLTNCSFDAWKSISDKQSVIHIRMNQNLKKGNYVTLSMGISWSASGFKDELISLADAALYKAKSNGRAGCCVFDSNHNSIYAWRDDIKNNSQGNALDESCTGACRIELPQGDIAQGRLICNETARALMGFDSSMSPEECFRTWLMRIDPYSRETIIKARKVMQEKGQGECNYIYQHPIQGQIMVRSGGRCLNNEDGVVFYGYHQSMQDTPIVLHEDDSQQLINSMMGLYFASYYISLEDDWFWIFKSTAESKHLDKQDTPASINIKYFVQSLVKPEHREHMNQFVDLGTLANRLKDREFVETEYESMVPDKGWCRIRFLAVRRDETGVVTHVQMLIASIDKEKKQEIENIKMIQKALQLQLQAGELLAQKRIQSIGLIKRGTGESEMYLDGVVSQNPLVVTFDQMKEWVLAKSPLIDEPAFDMKFNLEYIEEEIQRKSSISMEFHQYDDNHEVQTMIHHFESYVNDPSWILFVVERV